MRKPRQSSSTNIHHVMLRGLGRHILFEDSEDYEWFYEILEKCKKKSNFELYAYCIMDNHVHLLIKNIGESIGDTMRRIENSYHAWFRRKYDHEGSLFGGRFKSEPVETEKYFRTLISYIHNNPVKAGICAKADEYEYSSINAYKHNMNGLVDIFKSCILFCTKSVSEMFQFIINNNHSDNNSCLEIVEKKTINDNKALELFKHLLNNKDTVDFFKLCRKEQSKIMHQSLKNGLSIPQLRRFTGLSFKQLKILL